MAMVKEYKKRMENEYFEYNGVRYCAGTKFKMKKDDQIVIAIFLGYSGLNDTDVTIKYQKQYDRYEYFKYVKKTNMQNIVLEIVPGNYYVELTARKKHPKESEIPEMIMGWCLYIFVMLGLTIFNDRVAGWIAVTAFFFWWRHNKMEEEYYYYD